MQKTPDDPGAALAAAQTAIAQATQRLAHLAAERTAKLAADGDAYVVDVAKIDAEIVRLQTAVQTHQDRVAVMQRRQREHDQAHRAEQRKAAVAAVKKRVPTRQAVAEKLDAALNQLAAAYAELIEADTRLFADWGTLLPPPHTFGYLQVQRIDALSALRKERPPMAGLIHKLSRRVPYNFATEVEKRSRELVDELEGAAASQGVAA